MANRSRIARNASELSEWIGYHLDEARRSRKLSPGEQRAWIRKARQFVLLLDPEVETADGGLLPATLRDLTEDLTAIDHLEEGGNKADQVDDYFRCAVASFEAVHDAWAFTPDSLESHRREANPYFFDLPAASTESTAFVLMPFTQPWSDQVWQLLRRVVESVPVKPRLRCIRADDLYGHDVLLDIVSAIRSGQVVIADITSRNANVFYELGVAHAYGRRVILMTQTVEDIPFDLKRFRHVIYGLNPQGLQDLERGIKGSLLELLRGS